MKKVLLILLTATLFSCGARKSEVHKQEVEKTLIENTVTNTKEEVKETITKEIDTTVTIAENSIEGGRSAAEVLNGQTLIVENEFIKSETYFDKPSGQLKNRTTQKKRDIPLKGKEIIQRDIKREVLEDKKLQQHEKSFKKDKASSREGIDFTSYLGWMVLLIGFMWLIIFIWRKYKKAQTGL